MCGKVLLVILIGFGFLQAQGVLAHAVVTGYSLKIRPVQFNQATTIELKFNSKIELGLSQIFLVSKGDKHALLNISAGNQPGQVIVAIPALDEGEYALRLKVFATDGHLTEDIIRFSVGGFAAKTAPDLNRP